MTNETPTTPSEPLLALGSTNRLGAGRIVRVRWLHRLWTLGALGLVLQIIVNLALRDRWAVAAMAYYAVPNVVLAIAAAVFAWSGRHLGRSRPLLIAFQCCSAAAFASWFLTDFRFGKEPTRPPGTIRVVFWNVGRGWLAKSDEIAKHLGRFDADVLALAEATSDEMQSIRYWRSRLPNYSALILDDGLVLLVRGQATLRAEGGLRNRGEFRRVEVAVQGNRFDVIQADIVSDPWISRRPAFEALWKLMKHQANTPTLVVGDFNTPPNSVSFDHWRGDWARAWDSAGIGYQPTWPQPFPVLTLDHVWGNRWISFQRTRGGWSNCSDHRPVIVDFKLQPTSAEPGQPPHALPATSCVTLQRLSES